MSTATDRQIVIIGGGIIGCCTAYYLTRHSSYNPKTTRITVIEASKGGVAQGASGKAGGLVAKWAYPKELVNVSFQEHVKLAEEHNGKDRWGWRFVNCGNWEGRGDVLSAGEYGTGVGAGGKRKSLEKQLGLGTAPGKTASTQEQAAKHARKLKGLPDDLNWVKESHTDGYSSMAPTGATAQVHPYLFTTSMLELASDEGAVLLAGRATKIERTMDGKVTGVSFMKPGSSGDEQETIPATDVIVTAGAWSSNLLSWLPISSTRAHSITVRPREGVTIGPYVLFTEISLQGETVTPEIYARPDNEVYLCGPGDDLGLPKTVDDVVVDKQACESIHMHGCSISQELREGTVEKRQACYLPLVKTGGGPIVGKLTDGVYVGTGHTCWVSVVHCMH